MNQESSASRFDETPSPGRVKLVKELLAGLKDASGIAYRLDTGNREVKIDGRLMSEIVNVYVEGRHDDQFMRGYPILAHDKRPDALWRDELFDRLNNSTTYVKRGARCFMPGLAFKLTTRTDSVDLIFCLSCRYLYVFHSDDPLTIPLSCDAATYFRGIYFRLFPDQRPLDIAGPPRT